MCRSGMTRNVLPTDIELASRLVAAGRPTENVVAALVSRGVDAASAAQVADDLLHGRKVEPQIPAALEITPRRRHRSKDASPPGEPISAAPPPEAPPRSRPRSRSGSKRGKLTIVQWLLGVAAGCAVVGAIGMLVVDARRHADNSRAGQPKAVVASRDSVRSANSNQTQPQVSLPVGKLAVAGQTPGRNPSSGGEQKPAVGASDKPMPAQLVVELKPEGLFIRGKLITPGNVLGSVSEILGAPRQASKSGPSDKGVYIFDSQGLLVYTGQGAGKSSIVLDCEGSGGDDGAGKPFTGLLRIEDQVIRADTDSETLAGIKQLGLTNAGTSGGILSGHYHNLDLAFAYLKGPQRLSLIEIGLK